MILILKNGVKVEGIISIKFILDKYIEVELDEKCTFARHMNKFMIDEIEYVK